MNACAAGLGGWWVRQARAIRPRSLGRVSGVAHRRDGSQRGPGVGEHRGAGLRDPHRAAGAVEQRLAEFPLQPADLRAHPGLGDVGLGRGLGEARLVGHGHQVLKLT
jgi:hypothetical protein